MYPYNGLFDDQITARINDHSDWRKSSLLFHIDVVDVDALRNVFGFYPIYVIDRNLCVSPGLTDISKSGVIPANYSNGTGDVQEIIYATHISGGMDSTLNMPNRIVLDKLSYIDGVLFKYKGIYKLSSDGK